MLADLVIAAGGLGLFMIGMVILTDGLSGFAGGALRRTMQRFTQSPVSGAAVGAAATAVVQSSSATTVTAVGFVGAGVLTFPQALGVIFGANIGTTLTGWMVALIGFKLDLATAAPPLLLVGALLRLFVGGKAGRFGWTLAGFSLLFMGVAAMTSGLSGFEGVVTPADFPEDTLAGRLQLVAIGVAVTLVTQSSSAGVATALSALAAGAISLPQAAAMVIGMDVGTTATALIAAAGGSLPMRRTGYAHVVYNLLTGALAFLLLWPFAYVADRVGAAAGDAQLALVAFHSGFNVLGVLLVLPFAGAFARLIERLAPDRGDAIARRLDPAMLREPAAAVDVATAALKQVSRQAFKDLDGMLAASRVGTRSRQLRDDLDAIRRYLDMIRTADDGAAVHRRHVAALHVLDHLERLAHRMTQTERIDVVRSEPQLAVFARALAVEAARAADDIGATGQAQVIDALRNRLRDRRDGYREEIIAESAGRRIGLEAAIDRMDGIRWLHRVSYHLWRIAFHLERAASEAPAPVRPAPAPEATPTG